VKGIQRRQIDWIQSAPIVGLNLSVSGGSTDVSTPLATLLNTAGRGSVAVPVQVSTSDAVIGLIVTGANNRITLRNAATKDPIRSGEEEVYARLTNAGAVYTFTFYSNANGTEAAYSFASTTAIDFVVPYRFDADRFPTDALISAQAMLLNPDVVGTTGATFYAEPLTIATVNTVPALTKTPTSASVLHLTVNGVVYWATTPSPAFSVTGKTITWSAANSFTLAVGSDVVATYTTNE
jgi:hypothetical protein